MFASPPSSRPADRLAWLWLLAGAALLPFIHLQTVIPWAAWLAPVFLLRFARTQRALVALPAVIVAHYLASAVALRDIFPWPMPLVFGLAFTVSALAYGADMLLARRLSGLARTLVFPAAATVLDWLFGLSPLGTLGSPAYSQAGQPALIQLVSITGIAGLVFLMAWFASVVNEVWQGGRGRILSSAAPFAAALAALVAFGSLRVAFFPPSAPTVRIAGLAADRALWHGLSVPPQAELAAAPDAVRAAARAEYAPLLDELFERTRQQARAGAQIVVWSEAAAFVLKEDEPALIDRAQALAREEGLYLQMALVVNLRTNAYPWAENRTLMIAPSGEVVWDYAKTIHPLGDAEIFAPGPGVVPVVETPFGRLATIICFDADFPALVRQAGQARADILLVPANDWSPIHVMHAWAATFRAVENGAALVRPAGNGLSLAVDHQGRVLAAADYFATDKLTMMVDVPTRGGWTPYPWMGDGPVYAASVLLAGLCALAFARRRPALAYAPQPA